MMLNVKRNDRNNSKNGLTKSENTEKSFKTAMTKSLL